VTEITRLCLFESVSLPILTYGCESMYLFDGDIKKLNVCWNNVFRKIFGMNVWESVKQIQFFCGRLDLIHIVLKKSNELFMSGEQVHESSCLSMFKPFFKIRSILQISCIV